MTDSSGFELRPNRAQVPINLDGPRSVLRVLRGSLIVQREALIDAQRGVDKGIQAIDTLLGQVPADETGKERHGAAVTAAHNAKAEQHPAWETVLTMRRQGTPWEEIAAQLHLKGFQTNRRTPWSKTSLYQKFRKPVEAALAREGGCDEQVA